MPDKGDYVFGLDLIYQILRPELVEGRLDSSTD